MLVADRFYYLLLRGAADDLFWLFYFSSSLLALPMAQRVTLRKRQPYNTTSNRRRVVKTPGGKLVYHHLKKPASAPKCGDCGIALPGVPALRPRKYATISKRQKTVQRAYGGSRCGDCVKSRYESQLINIKLWSVSSSSSVFCGHSWLRKLRSWRRWLNRKERGHRSRSDEYLHA
jgi:large subunit ribosomal protein L34e